MPTIATDTPEAVMSKVIGKGSCCSSWSGVGVGEVGV